LKKNILNEQRHDDLVKYEAELKASKFDDYESIWFIFG